MTAATTFASIALLNMLIAPLNAFPWVLNGLVEAWISLKRVQSYLDVINYLVSTHFSDYYYWVSTFFLSIFSLLMLILVNIIHRWRFLHPVKRKQAIDRL